MEPAVRIVSDNGIWTGTNVYVNGRPLPGVVSVSWTCKAGELAEAVITVDNVALDATTLDEIARVALIDPATREPAKHFQGSQS